MDLGSGHDLGLMRNHFPILRRAGADVNISGFYLDSGFAQKQVSWLIPQTFS
jgi:hypothetical protein